ncbi:MAG: hypothetical protein COA69_03760 [Robiginitomaculum sp.]|nr:MAG: hypothetical protein COA69_03760 [Robiginitomaculum sp.]
MLKTYLKSTVLGRFLKDNKGTAAIEFIFIAPVMLITYFGLAEISLVVSADRGVSHATSVAADLSTQSEILDDDTIEDIFNATLAVMSITPTQAARVSIDMISFEKDGSGNITEVGYAKLGSGLSTKFTPPATLSAALLNATSGLLVARIEYKYVSPSGLGYYVKTPTLSETFMLKPRKSTTIPFINGSSSTVTCTLTTVNSKPRASC